jgi:hypothetical protein
MGARRRLNDEGEASITYRLIDEEAKGQVSFAADTTSDHRLRSATAP